MIIFIQGIIFTIISLILKYKSTNKINSFYGFRTRKSMRNPQEWNQAQNLFRIYLKKSGTYQLISGIIIALIEFKLYFAGYTNVFVILIIIESILNSYLLLRIIKKINNQI